MISQQSQQSQPIPLSNSPFFRQYSCQELPPISASTTLQLSPSNNYLPSKSKIAFLWPIEDKVIPDKNTFYYVVYRQPFISIYSALPSTQKHNLIINQFVPLDVHICNRMVYVLMSGGLLATFALGTTEVEYESIGQLDEVGKIYSMHVHMTTEGRQLLKIAYQKGGFKYYEYGGSQSLFSGIFGSIKLNNVTYLCPITPNNLLGFVATNQKQLKFINLCTKQFIDCEPIQLQGNVHVDNLRLRFFTRSPKLRRKGYVTLLMCVFYKINSSCQLYQIKLKQSTPVDSLVDLDDFVSGDIGREAEIKHLATFIIKGEIEDITFSDQGIFIFYKKSHNFPILKSTYRALNQILKEHPVEMLQWEVFRSYWQQKKVENISALRNRLMMPQRFSNDFITSNIGNQNIYTKLMESNLSDTRMLINRLTTSHWPESYKLVALVNLQGIIFVVRRSSISMLLRNTYGMEDLERYYYETEVAPFEKPLDVNSEDKRSVSRMSAPPEKVTRQRRGIVELDPQSLKFSLMRVTDHSKQQGEKYKQLMSAFRHLMQFGKYQQIQYKNSNSNIIIMNTVLSQIRHTIKVLAVLAKRLYVSSFQDQSSNDIANIIALGSIYTMIYNPFKLYQHHLSNDTSCRYISYDLLTCFIVDQMRNGNTFSFGSFEDNDYLKIISMLFSNLVDFNKDMYAQQSLVSFNQSNELLRFLVAQSQKNTHLKSYLEDMVRSPPVLTNLTLLKALLLTDNSKEFSARVSALAVSPDFSCKFLSGLFPANTKYKHGKSILEALSMMFQQNMTSQNLETEVPSQYRQIIQSLFKKCNKTQLVERYQQELSYLDNMNTRNLLNEFINKKRILQLTQNNKLSADPFKIYTLVEEIFRRQCRLFNRIIEEDAHVDSEDVRKLLFSMHLNVKSAVKNYAASENVEDTDFTNYIKLETQLLKNFEPYILGRMPTAALLDLLSKAQGQYPENKIIEFSNIPLYFMKYVLSNSDRLQQQLQVLRMYFSQKQIIKALIANTSHNPLLKQKQATSALTYGMVDYYKCIGNQDKINQVMRIIKNSNKFRSFQKQITHTS